MTLIDGKKVADDIKREIAAEVDNMVASGMRRPHLAAILVGHDGGSETYVANKVKACEVCGFKSTLIRYEEEVTEQELLDAINKLNADPDVDGFIVQLPLPKHISEQRIIEAIDYRKDVDGFHPINVGRMSIGLPCFMSATPAGIVELLRRYNVPTRGANCVGVLKAGISGNADQWLIIDLKAQKTSVQSISVYFYKLVWSRDYKIQTRGSQSEEWTDVYRVNSSDRAGSAQNPTDVISGSDAGELKRYVRFLFLEGSLNPSAGGHRISIREIEINGAQTGEDPVSSAQEALAKLPSELTVLGEEGSFQIP